MAPLAANEKKSQLEKQRFGRIELKNNRKKESRITKMTIESIYQNV